MRSPMCRERTRAHGPARAKPRRSRRERGGIPAARMRYEGGLSNYQSVADAEMRSCNPSHGRRSRGARFTLDVELVQALGGGYAQT